MCVFSRRSAVFYIGNSHMVILQESAIKTYCLNVNLIIVSCSVLSDSSCYWFNITGKIGIEIINLSLYPARFVGNTASIIHPVENQ